MHGTLDVSNLAQETDACFRFWIPFSHVRPKNMDQLWRPRVPGWSTEELDLPFDTKAPALDFCQALWSYNRYNKISIVTSGSFILGLELCASMVCKRHLQMFWLICSILLIICRFHLAATGKPAPLPQDPQTKPLRWTLSHLQCR